MEFKDKFNELLNKLNCTSRKLSVESGISESVISRYRSGERTPKSDSKQIKKIIEALYNVSLEQKSLKYTRKDIEKILINSLKEQNPFDYDSLSKNLNELILALNINISDMSKYIVFDSSHISRIRYGKTKPSDPLEFSTRVSNYIATKYNSDEEKRILKELINCNDVGLQDKKIFETIYNYLTNSTSSPSKDYINDFLNNLDNFNLNNYIKAIKFDELKVPNIPFYIIKNKTYYGIEEMKKGELDFFKATVLSKNKGDIFMCSDMPMEDMAKDIDFGKKWMFAIAMSLKKGLHINIIHNLDRPFNEMMLGLESWIPIYMTGQVSPYYLKEVKNTPYNHLNYVSGVAALSGECIKGYHNKGKYYLTSNSRELEYYQEKKDLLLKKANSLMDIYNESSMNKLKTFLLKDAKVIADRKRVLSSLPLFTINDDLLLKILKRNKLSKEEIKKIVDYKKEEEKNINIILKNGIITDNIFIEEKSTFDKDNIYLSLENIFYKDKIKYTYEEYKEHLKNTRDYSKNNKNYKININSTKTFNNISINIVKDNYVVITKQDFPTIHFIIRHPKLIEAINNFNPLVIEKDL